MSKKILYVDMDDTICDYSGHLERQKRNTGLDFPQGKLGFYFSIPALSEALCVVRNLSLDYNIYILSAPSLVNTHCYTEKRLWLDYNLGKEYGEKLILSPDKSLLKGDYLIDDLPNGKGQENFEGELIVYGSQKFRFWWQIESYFANKK